MSSGSERSMRKRERNKRRMRCIRQKGKEKVKHVHAMAKELEVKTKELVETRSRLMQTRKRALQLSTEACKAPKKSVVFTTASSVQTRYRARLHTKPTASSGVSSTSRDQHQHAHTVENVPVLDPHSLKIPHDGIACEIGSGTFGKCTRMFLSGTEVAVKTTILEDYSYHSILHEAKVMAEVCRGHLNLPLFIGLYEQKEHL